VRFQLLLAWLALVVAASWPLLTSLESLWVDELHSAWVVDGPWKEVLHRAALGNQSGLYFGGLKLWQSLLQVVLEPTGWFVPPEFLLRLFSWFGWIAIIGWLGYWQRHRPSSLFILAGWLWLDRIGSFYAIETRPYVWVALLSAFVMSAATCIPRDPWRIHWTWILGATLIFYTHYTSVILVALSIFAACIDLFLTSIRNRLNFISMLRHRVTEMVIFVTLAVPGLISLLKIGGKSQQWNDFAGNYSFHSIVELLPWLAWCVVPAVLLIGEKIVGVSSMGNERLAFPLPRSTSSARRRGDESLVKSGQSNAKIFLGPENDRRWLIQAGVVGFGVMCVVWGLTSLGIAPLMHRRYAMGAYPALLMMSSCLVGRIRSRSLVVLAGFASLFLLGWLQGTFSEWRHGRWLAWQRQEDWRLASEYLVTHASPDEPVFVAPMLIETRGTELPIDLPVEYLTAPLITHYRIFPDQKLTPLPNDRRGWSKQIVQELDKIRGNSAWVVVRSGFPERFSGPLLEGKPTTLTEKTLTLSAKLNAGRVQLFYAKPLKEEP
jgi:mannosyltransferase